MISRCIALFLACCCASRVGCNAPAAGGPVAWDGLGVPPAENAAANGALRASDPGKRKKVRPSSPFFSTPTLTLANAGMYFDNWSSSWSLPPSTSIRAASSDRLRHRVDAKDGVRRHRLLGAGISNQLVPTSSVRVKTFVAADLLRRSAASRNLLGRQVLAGSSFPSGRSRKEIAVPSWSSQGQPSFTR
jgi:hypothetical protein